MTQRLVLWYKRMNSLPKHYTLGNRSPYRNKTFCRLVINSKHSIAYQKQHGSVNGSDNIKPSHTSNNAFKSRRPKLTYWLPPSVHWPSVFYFNSGTRGLYGSVLRKQLPSLGPLGLWSITASSRKARCCPWVTSSFSVMSNKSNLKKYWMKPVHNCAIAHIDYLTAIYGAFQKPNRIQIFRREQRASISTECSIVNIAYGSVEQQS
jgi:hypothetical protein